MPASYHARLLQRQLLAQRGELPVAAVVAGFVDEDFGFGEMLVGLGCVSVFDGFTRGDQMVVGEMEPHAGARGDAKDFFEIAGRAAGEHGAGKVVEVPSASEGIDGLMEMISCFG